MAGRFDVAASRELLLPLRKSPSYARERSHLPLVLAEGLDEELGLGFVALGDALGDADGLAVPVALGDVLGDAVGDALGGVLGEGVGVVDVMRKGRVV